MPDDDIAAADDDADITAAAAAAAVIQRGPKQRNLSSSWTAHMTSVCSLRFLNQHRSNIHASISRNHAAGKQCYSIKQPLW